MSLTKRVGLLAGTTALTLTCGSLAGTGADAEKSSDLEARLAAAEAKIAQMTATSKDSWLTEQRADEIRSLVQDVLADADTRSSLLSQGVTAGYDNGAVLGSSDGNWLLRTNLLIQQRFMYRMQDSSPIASVDENRWGFETTRAKFMLSGHVVNPDWTYRVDADLGSNNRGAINREAWIGYNYGDGWSVRMGQMKSNFNREDYVEAHHQLAIERSELAYAFTPGYVDGIRVGNKGEQFSFAATISDGARTGGSAAMGYDTDFALTSRIEFLAMGNWEQFEDFTSPQGSEQGLMIGVSIHRERAETGLPLGGGVTDNELTLFNFDVSWEGDGFNVFFAVMFSDFDNNAAAASPDTTGYLLQGGYYLNETWELYGRYEAADWDVAGVEDLGIFTIGVNKYIAGHNAKWSTDIGFAIDGVDPAMGVAGLGGAGPSGFTGYGADDLKGGGTEDGQILFRTQLQILF